jgi:hypothetical protein
VSQPEGPTDNVGDKVLDLVDPRVRAMADRHHQPSEMWSMAGRLPSDLAVRYSRRPRWAGRGTA